MNPWIKNLFFFSLIPLLTATTYIVKEGNVEVGRWEEADGSDAVKTVSMAAMDKHAKPLPPDEESVEAPSSAVSPLEQKKTESEAEERKKRADAEAEKWKLAKEKREVFGIRRGLTQKRVDQILTNKGVQLYSKYSQADNSPETMRAERLDTLYYGTMIDWVHEYRYKTDNFSHVMKVFYNPKKEVSKVTHQSERR